MKLPDRILFVGAHCDDIELMAGGLLTLACRSGREVGLLVFSDHRGVVADTEADQARTELHTNVEWLRSSFDATIVDHSQRFLPACRGHFASEREYLYERFEELRARYDLVVTHSATDTNQDHRQIALEAARALKGHCSILCGEFPNNDLGDFEPRVYVELEAGDVDAKVDLVAAYRSQRFGGRSYFDESVIRGLAAVRGSQIRAAAAEAYTPLRLRFGA